MHVTTIDRYLPAPGEFVEWILDPADTDGATSPVPPSFNQSVHLSGAGDTSTWLAASFDVTGPIDYDALEFAYLSLIARHPTLCSSFSDAEAGGVQRLLHGPPSRLVRQPGAFADTPEKLRELLWRELNTKCRPRTYPAYLLAAIDRPGTSTVLCGFDHIHVDAYSIAIIIDDLLRLYSGRAESLTPTGSFIDYCAAPSTAPDDDPALRRWREFFAEGSMTPPSFPLDLGVTPGTSAAQAVELRPVLNAEATDRFETMCRTNGASLFAGFLVAMADSVKAMGGTARMPVLFPVHTRHRTTWRNAVGWFTSNAPVEIVAVDDIAEALRRNGQAVRAAVALGGIPMEAVVRSLGGLKMVRDDVFMVSYVDYRSVPGAEHHRRINAQHISNVSSADDAQFWLSRTHEGVALRVRYPDTPRARVAIAGFLDVFDQTLLRFRNVQPWS